jgi:osmoprotectant transport system permease protein
VLVIGVDLTPLVIALVVLAVPPLLAGTYAGVRNVDPAVVDAARGMGMRESQVLLRVELPVALPLILGGLRTATLQVIATAAIGAVIAQQNLGRYIVDGLALNDFTQMAAGALLIAVLALATEGLLALATRGAVSPGLRAVPIRSRAPRPVTSSVPAGGTA